MSYSNLKQYKSKSRYRIKNWFRAISALLVVLLIITAVFVILAKSKENNQGNNAGPTHGIAPVEPTPSQTHNPTPTPYPVPAGKSMDPFLIVLDPGHGGRDSGTYSPQADGLYEKDIVLDISKRVRDILVARGINVVMTREEDIHLDENVDDDLIARWSFANEENASLFVSIHVNGFDLKKKGAAGVNGMEIYYFEDKPEAYADFTQQQFAEIMRDSVTQANGMTFRFMEGGIRLAVVRNTTMPAVLIETAYITNKEDHDRLTSDDFRENTARGIADGIELAMEEIGVFEYNNELYVFKEIGE